MFGTKVKLLQEDVVLEGSHLNGTLKYYDDPQSSLVQSWGPGYFLAMKMTSNAEVVLAGLDPSEGSGLQPLDQDMNGVWKITNKDTQNFRVIADGTLERNIRLSTLTLEEPVANQEPQVDSEEPQVDSEEPEEPAVG